MAGQKLKREDRIGENYDDRLNPTQIQNAEQKTGEDADINAGVDQAEAYANDPDNASSNRDEVNAKEQAATSKDDGFYKPSGGSKPTKMTMKMILKRGGPLGLGALIFGGAGLGLFFLSPGLLLVQVKEVLTNYGASSSRAAIPRHNKMLAYTIGNSKVDKACAKKPTGTKCKLGTMSENQKKAYEKAGFKMAGKDYNGRTRVTKVTFPDGHSVTSGSAFTKYTKRNISAASAANRAHNPATKVFNGARFANNVLKNKFNQSKNKVTLEGDTEEERKNNLNTKTGENITEEERGQQFKDKYEDRTKSKVKGAGKLGRFAGGVALACAAYNTSRAITTAVKIENGIRFVNFAMQFLKVADQIKDNGDVDPETVSTLGNVLTATAASGAKAGLAATDSQGYKVAAYGGEGALKDFTQAFLLGGNPYLMTLDDTIHWIQGKAGGKSTIRTACRAAGNPVLAAAMVTAMCAVTTGGGAVAGTVVPGAGNIAGAFTAALSCILTQVMIFLALNQLINLMVGWAIEYAISALTNAELDVNKISSVDAGNGLAVGAGVMLSATNMSRGMKAGNKDEVTGFLAATADEQARTEEIARYDAQSEPFNVNNEYSFMGSLLRKTGIALRAPTSLGENVTNFATIVRSSASSFSTAQASPASMPVSINDADLSACPDRDMTDIGIDCDRMGNPQFVLSETELNMEVQDNLDYMIEKHGFVDEETGEPTEDDNSYAKWVKNCTEQREGPMGSTMMAIEEDDYDWGTGENCLGETGDGHASNTDLSNFRVYYNTLAEKEDADYVPPASSDLAGGSTFTAATFNLRGASHTDGNFKERSDKALNVIKSNSLHVVGLQEAESDQRKYILDNLQTFEAYPTETARQPNPIIWDTTKFSFVEGGMMPNLSYFNNNELQAPWVILEDKETQQQLYVLNTHDPAKGYELFRYQNAKNHAKFIKSIEAKGLPIIFTGDFNSGYSLRDGTGNDTLNDNPENLAYCILNKEATMSDAYDLAEGREFKCPNPGNDNAVDHIFVSAGVQVESFKRVGNNGSDHDTHIADIVIPGAGSGAGTDFIIGTYNQKRSLSESQHRGAVQNIIDKKMDVVGTQETTDPKYSRYKETLATHGYGVFPDRNYSGYKNQTCSYAQSIFYNKDKFNLMKGTWFEIPRYTDPAQDCGDSEKTTANHDTEGGKLPEVWTHIPVVWLQDKQTGQTIIVINTHNVANVAGSRDMNPAYARYVSAKIYIEQIKELKASNPHIPIFMTGDFNEGHTIRTSRNVTYQSKAENLFYCMVKANGLMKSIFVNYQCSNVVSRTPVDAIYVTPEVEVDWLREIQSGGESYSDHPVKYAHVIVPGSGQKKDSICTNNCDGWAWPVPTVKSMGTLPYGATGSKGVHKGIDIGISGGTALGKPVVAAHAGTVVRVWGQEGDPCGAYVSIKAQGTPYYAAYQHLNSKIIVKEGQEVIKGEKIGFIGPQGGSTCGSSGFYHLHFSIESRPGMVSAYADPFPNGTKDPLKILPRP